MRVRLLKKDLIKLFSKIPKKKSNLNYLAILIGANKRTLNDWKGGKTTIPIQAFEKLVSFSNLTTNDLRYETLKDFWHAKEAGRKGAFVRMQLHGNFGTPEGRRRGGSASMATHKKRGTKFYTLKNINLPKFSDKLAEFLGIMFGDGHLSYYQASITTNSKTDKEHVFFICRMIKELFGVTPTIKNKEGENSVNITASSRKMVIFLNKIGMPIGNKIRSSMKVPLWIAKKKSHKKSFIRGLFDTDGCIYIDTHKNRNKTYKHFGWTITSYAENFILDIMKILQEFDYSPTHRLSQKSVYLRKQNEIKKYFTDIGSDNPKHIRRFRSNI